MIFSVYKLESSFPIVPHLHRRLPNYRLPSTIFKSSFSTVKSLRKDTKMVTGPLAEMLVRNRYVSHTHSHNKYSHQFSKFAQTYQAPPGLMQMATAMRGTGAGVVVLSCSDPRLNPYQILGIDPTLSEP
jgi:Ni,Fe-hydrogenase I large subunit